MELPRLAPGGRRRRSSPCFCSARLFGPAAPRAALAPGRAESGSTGLRASRIAPPRSSTTRSPIAGRDPSHRRRSGRCTGGARRRKRRGLRAEPMASPRARRSRSLTRCGPASSWRCVACAFVAGPRTLCARPPPPSIWASRAGIDSPGYRLDAWIDPRSLIPARAPMSCSTSPRTARAIRAASTRTIAGPGGVDRHRPLLRRRFGRGRDQRPPPATARQGRAEADGRGRATTRRRRRSPRTRRSPRPTASILPGSETRLILHGDSRLVLRHGGGPARPLRSRRHRQTNRRPSRCARDPEGQCAGIADARLYRRRRLRRLDQGRSGVRRIPEVDGVPAPASSFGASLVDPAPKDRVLSVPGQTERSSATARPPADLSEHPWAGARG